jgi:hypothetical protein
MKKLFFRLQIFLIVFLIEIVFINVTPIAFAFPSVSLNGSAIECAGGWNSNFLYLRLSNGNQSWLEPAAAGKLVGSAGKKIKDNIKKIKNDLKRASKKNRVKLQKKLTQQNLLLKQNRDLDLAVRACFAGTVVGSSPASTTGTGLITSANYAPFGGGLIYAYNGQFLGVLSSNLYSSDSINNSFGAYGNKFSPTSMFNQFSSYGGRFAIQSPFNQFSVQAPIVYLGAQPVAYITNNQYIYGARIDPSELFTFLGRASDIP